MRGAWSVPLALASRQASALRVSLPTSRIAVIPQASQILNSYSIGCARSAALVLHVRVGVDQPGQHVFAGRVDLGRVRVRPRTTIGAVAPQSDRVERDELGDRAALDDDVERSLGRSPVPVDDRGVADDESSRSRSADDRRLRGGRTSDERQCEEGREAAHEMIIICAARDRKSGGRWRCVANG